MKSGIIHSDLLKGIIKDLVVSLLLFVIFFRVDFRSALIISLSCLTVLMTKRAIDDLKPGNTRRKEKLKAALTVPQGTDIYDLHEIESFKNLPRYLEIMLNILIPPRIVIIRLGKRYYLNQGELESLNWLIRRLKEFKVVIMLSDINERMRNYLVKEGILELVGEGHVFVSLDQALEYAVKMLHSNDMTLGQ